jgi:hypothetical protein
VGRNAVWGMGVGALFAMAACALAGTPVGGVICSDTTWDLAHSPYIVTNSIIVSGGATLTIEPGVEIRFDPGRALTVGYEGVCPDGSTGTLVAKGTPDSRIRFTSSKPSPNAGDWTCSYFTGDATDAAYDDQGQYVSGSILEQCIVEYAGNGAYAALMLDDSSPYLNRCEIRHNAGSGISAEVDTGPALRIKNSEIYDCAGARNPACSVLQSSGTWRAE